ncbi:hypothetical protein L7F22_000462 [Adiantum nelumboides]|nr:hypothetical protein [Adiantum nelumboides]
MVEIFFEKKLKVLRTDNGGEYTSSKFKAFCSKRGICREFTTPYTHAQNGGEYTSSKFKAFCSKRGICREFTTPYTPAQNGIAEQMNRTIQERVIAMLSMASLPPEFWGESVMTAVHIINRSPSTPLNFKIPQEMWTGKKPNYDRLRVFGCEAFSHISKDLRKKLDLKSHKCIFIGYGVDGEMGYRL